MGTDGVSFGSAVGSALRLAAVALMLAGHGVLPEGSVVSSITTNVRVFGAGAANTDNGHGVGYSVV